jgi:hypothetical protein
MSDTLAVSLPQPAPSTGRNWIKANVMAALIIAAAGLGSLLIGHALGAGTANIGRAAQAIVVLAYVLATGAGAAAYAVLVGRVLRDKLPAFPMRIWTVLHVAAGLGIGLLFGYEALQPPADMKELTEMLASPAVMVGMAAFGLAVGAMGGLLVGSFQALIMRRAASGLGAWIGFWVVAGVLGMMVHALMFVTGQPLTSVTGEILAEAIGFLAAVIMTFTMLPAVIRLAPR